MKFFHLNNMIGGWLVGNFEPHVIKSKEIEVAVKYYIAGQIESPHHHKITTEITVIVQGKVIINGEIYEAGSIIQVDPNESIEFTALTDAITTVIKTPSASNDKYMDALK